MDSFYDRKGNYQGLSDNNLDQRYLSLSGINRMPRPFKGIPGRRNRPSYCSQESEQDGLYFPAPGVVAITCQGLDALWVQRGTLRVWDRFGNYVDLVLPDQLGGNFALAIPAQDGSLALKEHFESEQIIGTKDGVNTAFTVTRPIVKLLDVKINGVGDTSLVSWSSGSNALTWEDPTPPDAPDSVQIIYIW